MLLQIEPKTAHDKTILQRQVDATEEDKVEGSDLDFTQGYHVSSFAGVS